MTLPVFDKHKEYPKIKTGGIQMAQAKYDREIKELVVQRILNGETTTANMARPFLGSLIINLSVLRYIHQFPPVNRPWWFLEPAVFYHNV